jgi:tRNA nucleotidyltransferase/poly(A) polymerase
MRCFSLSAEFSLKIEDKTIKNIENSIKNGFISYKKPTLFNELHKILSYENCDKYIKYLYDLEILKILDMHYSNIDNLLNKLIKNKYNEDENMYIMLGLNEIDDIVSWTKKSYIYNANRITKSYQDIIIIIQFYKSFLSLSNKYEMLCFINKLNNVNYFYRNISFDDIYSGLSSLFFRYHYMIKREEIDKNKYYSLIKECYNYPFSINDIELKGDDIIEMGFSVLEINKIKETLLDLIYKDKVINIKQNLKEYIKKNMDDFPKIITE